LGIFSFVTIKRWSTEADKGYMPIFGSRAVNGPVNQRIIYNTI
jgi:hypothetical protein